jgi:hypothetical protein
MGPLNKKKGHGPRGGRGHDDEEELDTSMGNFFGSEKAPAGESAAVSARKQSRLDAEADECIAKYGAAPIKYEAASGADLDISREKAKSLIAARVVASAKKQKEKLPTKSKAARKLARESAAKKAEEDFQTQLADDQAKGKKRKNWVKRDSGDIDVTKLAVGKKRKPGKQQSDHVPRMSARMAKKLVKRGAHKRH